MAAIIILIGIVFVMSEYGDQERGSYE